MRNTRLVRLLSLATLAFTLAAQPSAAQEEQPGDGRGGGGCQNGGPKSSACSVDAYLYQCAVSCSAGYYACCTIDGCHCIRS